jgi:muramidase (phage lysozyme)
MPQPVISKTKPLPEVVQTKPQINVPSVSPKRNGGKPIRSKDRRITQPIQHVPVQAYNGRNYSKQEVEALIVKWSSVYGISDDTPRCIAFHESGYNQFSKNKRSSASGVFQYLSKTWRSTDEGKAGESVFDADANVKAAVKYMASRRDTKPWSVRSKCSKIQPK